ncbi:MAG: hypothetical protein Q9180_008475 [Flavoplaca navasiana]
MPHIPTSCFSGGGAQQTNVDGDDDHDQENPYQPQPMPSQGDNGYQQPTTLEDGPGGYQQIITTYGGGYGNPVKTSYQAYGQEDNEDDN